MSNSSVKKLLASMDKAQIIEVMMELYNARKEAKEYLDNFACPISADSVTRFFPLQQPKTRLSLEQKVELFRNLFVGRDDVFARRWFSKATNKGGYQPVCLNEWRAGVCDKKKTKCAECPNRLLKELEYEDIYRHLAGKDECGRDVVGLYPIREDGTCRLLCADFDDKSWEHVYKEDVLAYVAVVKVLQKPSKKHRLNLSCLRLCKFYAKIPSNHANLSQESAPKENFDSSPRAS